MLYIRKHGKETHHRQKNTRDIVIIIRPFGRRY